ncbi:uncharacterized protein LOC124158551 [Ischnura elegans]|uniref:uncharacterized protein LOC124158551 n=1 Tax=Ischnura elegans TaxID=197161 RepID=UPI001ED88272|nr:uncharacterized protein LOC124158551 [Ischnura elegans]
MPRVSKAKGRATGVGCLETEVRNEVKLLLRDRKRRHQDLLETVNNYYDNLLLELPADILEKPVSQLTKDDIEMIRNGKMKEKGAFAVGGSFPMPTASHTKGKVRNHLQVPESKVNKFETPCNQKVPPHHMGTVTPKFNPYAPMSVVRVPKEGELAMSLTGSPLQVTRVIHDSKANVIVPLENGQILSVLPERGLRMSQIPEMDDEVVGQLQVLNENLNKLLAKTRKH